MKGLKPLAVRTMLMTMVLVLTLAGWVAAQDVNVPQRYQLAKQPSWVACTQALCFYYGVWLTQPQINHQLVPATSSTDGDGRKAVDPWMGLDKLMHYFAGVDSVSHHRAFTTEELSTQLSAGRPVVIRWDWDTGGGQLLIVHGLSQGMVTVMDPWMGTSLTRYDWLVRGGNHTWTHTLELTTDPGPRRLAPFLLMLMKAH